MSVSKAQTPPLTPPMVRLIDALALAIVEDYLREQTAHSNASDDMRPDHAPLRDLNAAA